MTRRPIFFLEGLGAGGLLNGGLQLATGIGTGWHLIAFGALLLFVALAWRFRR